MHIKCFLWIVVVILDWSLHRASCFQVNAPCAQALLVVAHPDDETIYAGEILLGRVAALPGNCRNIAWHVVCATGGDNERGKDFLRALQVAREHSLAFEISSQIFDYPDCDSPECSSFDYDRGPSIYDRLGVIIASRKWDYVITHNAQGEYGHHQHIGLHHIVSDLLRGVGHPRLFVFNLLPELDLNISAGKQRMLQSFLEGVGFHPNRPAFLRGEARFTEHIITHSDFPRPNLLRLLGFNPELPAWASHFWYIWNAWQNGFGPFTSGNASRLVERMLVRVRRLTCSGQGMAFYTGVCMALWRPDGHKHRMMHLKRMEASFEPLFLEGQWEEPPVPWENGDVEEQSEGNLADCFTSSDHFYDCCCRGKGPHCQKGTSAFHSCCDHLVQHCTT